MTFQTPGGPAAKRRRIDDAAATLRKPFRSPLISRQQSTPGTGNNSHGVATASSTTTATPQTPATPLPARPLRSAAASPSVSSKRAGQQQHTATASPLSRVPSQGSILNKPTTTAGTPITNRHLNSTTTTNTGGPSSNTTDGNDDDNDNLLQRILTSQREMQLHVRAARQRLDLARQAAQIEQSARKRALSSVKHGEKKEQEEDEETVDADTQPDAELRGLVERWKTASRLAADELFGLIKERVDGMGGAKAWRESQKRQRDYYGGFEDGTVGEKGGGGGGEEDDDEGKSGEAGGREDEEQGQEDETEFTMLMMLKSLNIDPDILGYDPVEDKWRE